MAIGSTTSSSDIRDNHNRGRVADFLADTQTNNGEDMSRYNALLDKAVAAIAAQFGRKNAGNLFAGRGGKLTDASKQVRQASDFELITWLVIEQAS